MPIYDSPVTIGKNYPVPILSDTTVDENHVKFYKNLNGEWQMTDASQYGTFLRIPKLKPTKVAYGIFIVCGKTWINTVNRQCIELINEKFEVIKTFNPIMNTEITIGRHGAESIVIEKDDSISGFHAKLLFAEDGIIVTDWKNGAGSSNGTYISLKEMPITEEFILRIGLQTFCKVEPLYVTPSQYEPGSYSPYLNTMPFNKQPETATVKFGEKAPITAPAVIQSPMMNMTYQGDKPTYNAMPMQQQFNTGPLYTQVKPREQLSPGITKKYSNEIPTNKWE
jgi:hypothetical protein